jgi:hypothetical protein
MWGLINIEVSSNHLLIVEIKVIKKLDLYYM